ncbi:hypothetical protein [Actinomadura sp. 9N215]|uniref:hypothetical protein n=1 Tax=Actinomadura sp. 9N215 TaxID=3375150 RepID=UPI0037B8D1BF
MARGLFRLHTVPRRVQALAALVLLALVVLFTVTGVALWDARSALRAIGHDEGPMVVATNDVYLALSDMDAQVTNVLLTGAERDWLCDVEQDDHKDEAQNETPNGTRGGAPGKTRDGARDGGPPCERSQSRYFYDIRREDAQRAALQAARLAEDDPVRQRTVQSVLDGLHLYDERVQAAMERGGEARHAFGLLPEDAAGEYRAATRIMTEELLPKAGNLTLGGAADVEASYGNPLSRMETGRIWVLALGLAVLAALAGLQIYLAKRFRRVISLFLVAAAVGTAALTAAAASLLATEADYLRMAKEDGFDPVLRLSRTRATAKSLDADRTRALLDPSGADRYDQTYFEKAQAMLYIAEANDLGAYYAMLDERFERHGDDGRRQRSFEGFFGVEAAEAAVRGDRGPVQTLLARYRAYQQNDRRVRVLARGGELEGAARAHVDPRWHYLTHPSFREQDDALDARVVRHQVVVNRMVRDGEGALRPWAWVLPVSALAIAALVVGGVWPRLAEYR